MKLQVIQHVDFEKCAAIGDWAQSHGHTVSVCRPFAGETLPALADFDWLVVMGGPMSVNDEAELPWLIPEKKFVASAIQAGKKVLGICLGAQLIANVLGARVYPGKLKEIGWFPVQGTGADHPFAAAFPAEFLAFHWHGETFDLPSGAVHLAATDNCAHQAFAYGNTVLGLQFHMEATPASVAEITTNCAHEIGNGPYEQHPPLLNGTAEQFHALHKNLYHILNAMEKTTA